MGKSTQSFGPMEGLLGSDRLTEALREKVREMILTLAEVSPACCYDSHVRGYAAIKSVEQTESWKLRSAA